MDFFENRMPGIGQSQLNVELKRTRRKGESEEGVTAALCLVFQKGKDTIRSWVITAAGTVSGSRNLFWTQGSRALTGTEPWAGRVYLLRQRRFPSWLQYSGEAASDTD